MATTLLPPGSAPSTEQALRTPLIAANLLPVEIVDSRRARKVRRRVLFALVVFAVLLGGWYGVARYQTATARTGLTAIEDDARRVLRQQRDLAEVTSTQTESKAIRAQLGVLLADDLRWSSLLSAVARRAPSGVAVTGVSGALAEKTGVAGGGGSTAARLPNTSGHKAIGTLTVTGRATSKSVVAGYADTLATIPGLGNPLIGSANVEDGALRFTVRLDVTSVALGGRYTSTGDKASGGN